jgi:hypothetical protein
MRNRWRVSTSLFILPYNLPVNFNRIIYRHHSTVFLQCNQSITVAMWLFQRFRHVDNISFENEQLVNRFLDFWRRAGHQRIGYLLGRYEPFPEVPLGIKAVIAAIYEPPQVLFLVKWLITPHFSCSCKNIASLGLPDRLLLRGQNWNKHGINWTFLSKAQAKNAKGEVRSRIPFTAMNHKMYCFGISNFWQSYASCMLLILHAYTLFDLWIFAFQTSTNEAVGFEDDAAADKVNELCAALDLKRVGWIFTDLWSADPAKGTVHCTRHEVFILLSTYNANNRRNSSGIVLAHCAGMHHGRLAAKSVSQYYQILLRRLLWIEICDYRCFR